MLGAVANCWKRSSRIYVRLLCRWAVATTLAPFSCGLAVLGAVANCWKTELVRIYVPTCAVTSGKGKRKGKGEQKRKGEGKDKGEWDKQRVCVFFAVCCCRGRLQCHLAVGR